MPTVTTYPGVFGPYTPITFTRASTGTYFDSAGTLTTAAINAPRLDYNPSTLAAQGFLIEEARTNSIRNNTMVGAVAPSTFPTNWQSVIVAGLTATVVGTGTQNGITYLDVRVNGAPAVSTYYNLVPDILVAGASGQTWTGSFWLSVISGSLTNTNCNIEIRESDAAQAFLTNTLTLLPVTSTLTRYSQTRTLNNASTAFVSVRSVWQVTSGLPVDFTFRIGLPQLEQGAFATSVIPTTTTALTRSADLASVNTLSPWFNATQGTLFAEVTRNYSGNFLAYPHTASLSDGTNANCIRTGYGALGSQALVPDILVSSVNQLNYQFGTFNVPTAKIALAYKTNDTQFAFNSVAQATDTSCSIPAISKLNIGSDGISGSNNWGGWIRRITYYPRKLSSAELQAITTP